VGVDAPYHEVVAAQHGFAHLAIPLGLQRC
jgi:hypothetical protein